MKWLAILGLLSVCGSAHAQQITPAPSGYQRLFSTGTSVGNGADTTEDTLVTYNIPAGQLANVGDVIHVRMGGAFAASTDNKTVRIYAGGQSVLGSSGVTNTGATAWYADLILIKTGTNTQSYVSGMTINGNGAQARSGTLALTDTGTIQLKITGQDSTTATANAVTVQVVTTDYEH